MPKIPKKKNLQPAKTNFVFKFFKVFNWIKICLLFFFYANNEKKLSNIFLLYLRTTIVFAIFEEEKKY